MASSSLCSNLCILLLAFVTVGCDQSASTSTNQPVEIKKIAQSTEVDESQKLIEWLDEKFEESLNFAPQRRTAIGDKTDYDKLNDVSRAAAEQYLNWYKDSVAEMAASFRYENLNDVAKDSYDLWQFNFERVKAAWEFRDQQYVFANGGPHTGLVQFMINQHRVESLDDWLAYKSRLAQIDDVLSEYHQQVKEAAEKNIRPPRFAYEKTIEEIQRVLSGTPFTDGENKASLITDSEKKLQHLVSSGVITKERMKSELEDVSAILQTQMASAYSALAEWLKKDIDNTSSLSQGVWALPDGENYYANRLSHHTSTDLTADEIHNIGLSEVKRLRTLMEEVVERVGFDGSLADFFDYLRTDQQFYFPNTDEGREAYLTLADDYLSAINKKLPEYFGTLPKAPLVVKRVEAFREQPGAAQHYNAPTKDGSRPGIFYAHLADMRAMPKYQLEVIAYHEGNPGHHMQIAIAQELEDVPRFRQFSGGTAYIEGWALYSEQLAEEMGFYQDDYSYFGRLTTEMWRAIRLVVDTGMHAKQWPEEKAVQFFMENSPQPEAAIRSEIQRYLSWPGQATAYKIGMMKILELRTSAQEALGEKFEIRDFHDVVLGGGAVPLTILDTRVKRWQSKTLLAN